ncbi:MAG: glyoxalase [Bacteroidota bacterium]
MATTGDTHSSVFITFNGNCRQAFTAYHACFGGELYIESFEPALEGFPGKPVLKAVLKSSKLLIYGSDMVHNEGRRIGNYMALFVYCTSKQERQYYLQQLSAKARHHQSATNEEALVEMVDRFDVRWVFAV